MAISTKYEASDDEVDVHAVVGYPPPAQVMGVLMNSIFLDALDQDGFHPSRDLGRLARDYQPQLPRGFRFLTRGLGTTQMFLAFDTPVKGAQ